MSRVTIAIRDVTASTVVILLMLFRLIEADQDLRACVVQLIKRRV